MTSAPPGHFRRLGPPYRPAADAKDVRAVLFHWTWAMGKGKAARAPDQVQQRFIHLWASPQGTPKAALAGVTGPPVLTANRGELVPGGIDKAGKMPVSWENGKAVVTFPSPGVPGAIASATLDNTYRAERVVMKHGWNRVHLQQLLGV